MTKSEITKQLKNMDCEIAEVICDIKTMSGEWFCKSVLVFLVKQPSNDDLIKNWLHWFTCEDIDEFCKRFAFDAEEAKLTFQNWEITKVRDIKKFVSDFVN